MGDKTKEQVVKMPRKFQGKQRDTNEDENFETKRSVYQHTRFNKIDLTRNFYARRYALKGMIHF